MHQWHVSEWSPSFNWSSNRNYSNFEIQTHYIHSDHFCYTLFWYEYLTCLFVHSLGYSASINFITVNLTFSIPFTKMAQYNEEWKESLFGCFNNMGICLYGCCCLPCLYGRNAEKLDGQSCFGQCCMYYCLSACGCCCLIHKSRRELLRTKYHLREDPSDFIATCCCAPCMLISLHPQT